MGRVNEGGMHFVHYGKGIEKKEFEFDNKCVSSGEEENTHIPKTMIYKGKTYQVVSVQQIENNDYNKKITPNKLDECNYAIGCKVFRDSNGKKHICILLMHKLRSGFKLDLRQRYVLRMWHSFTTVDVMVRVTINKDHSVPIKNWEKNTRIEIDKNACWVASCFPIPETKKLIKMENNKYRIDYSVWFDRGLEVECEVSLAEEELNTTVIGKDLWNRIRDNDVKKLFLLPGFYNYCN